MKFSAKSHTVVSGFYRDEQFQKNDHHQEVLTVCISAGLCLSQFCCRKCNAVRVSWCFFVFEGTAVSSYV